MVGVSAIQEALCVEFFAPLDVIVAYLAKKALSEATYRFWTVPKFVVTLGEILASVVKRARFRA